VNVEIAWTGIKFEPRDIWIGVFWDEVDRDWRWEHAKRAWDVYVCLLPCLPLKFRVIVDTEWIRLGDLEPGAIFETAKGTKAVKTEYYYSSPMPGAQCECVLLESGEYAHFPDKDDTLVRRIG